VALRWVFPGLLAALALGCSSDAGDICDRLDACGLLPEGKTSSGESYGAEDCEEQVEDKVSEARRERCARCVSSHECGEITTACRADCQPEPE
jgi:hypothetical protein